VYTLQAVDPVVSCGLLYDSVMVVDDVALTPARQRSTTAVYRAPPSFSPSYTRVVRTRTCYVQSDRATFTCSCHCCTYLAQRLTRPYIIVRFFSQVCYDDTLYMSVYFLSPWYAEFVSFSVTTSNKVYLHYTIAISIKYGLSEEIDLSRPFPEFFGIPFQVGLSWQQTHTNRQTLTILCVYISCEENDELWCCAAESRN